MSTAARAQVDEHKSRWAKEQQELNFEPQGSAEGLRDAAELSTLSPSIVTLETLHGARIGKEIDDLHTSPASEWLANPRPEPYILGVGSALRGLFLASDLQELVSNPTMVVNDNVASSAPWWAMVDGFVMW